MIDVQGFTGRLLANGHPEYDAARRVWNGVIDRRPEVIAQCETAHQVAAAVREARRHGLEIAVRGGGHNYAGHAVCDGGMMIHLGAMNAVRVDAAQRRAVVGGGASWAQLDAATQQHGLAAPGGFISHTGVAGLTLGGGVGWLTKHAGLSCDNLVGAEVVTADSRIVRATAEENADLLWGLRGGGGNFGIVTSFEFVLQPVGPIIHMAMLFWALDVGTEALRHARDSIGALPANTTGFIAMGLNAPPAPFVPEQHRGKTGHALLVVGFGSAEEHASAVERVASALPPLFRFGTPMPYVALQQMFDESAFWGQFAYEKSLFLDDLTEGVLSVIAEHVPKKSSPLSFCPTFSLAGAYQTAPADASAFGGRRSAGYLVNLDCAAPVRELYEPDRQWVRSFWEALRPHAKTSANYVNFLVDGDEDVVKTAYGEEKYAKLAALKARYDPENVFHRNVNIKPR
jgi:FAD/FMN-containing dehydrogenase